MKVLLNMLSLFTKGDQGTLVYRTYSETYRVNAPLDIAGAQSIPLMLLQDDTSWGMDLIFDGLLQMEGRAHILGVEAHEQIYAYSATELVDHSHLVMPGGRFQPKGKAVDAFSDNGVLADIPVAARWDLFTDASDPLFAKAIELLMRR